MFPKEGQRVLQLKCYKNQDGDTSPHKPKHNIDNFSSKKSDKIRTYSDVHRGKTRFGGGGLKERDPHTTPMGINVKGCKIFFGPILIN